MKCVLEEGVINISYHYMTTCSNENCNSYECFLF